MNSIEFESDRIICSAKNWIELLVILIYSPFTISNGEKISISLMNGNFSRKDVNDGVINKQKQKAAVEGGVTNDLKD